MSAELRNQLAEVFNDLAQDEATEVVVFTGAGRAFTVGLDLKELGGEKAAETVINKDLGKAMLMLTSPLLVPSMVTPLPAALNWLLCAIS